MSGKELSWNHRNLEWFGLEGLFKGLLVQPPAGCSFNAVDLNRNLTGTVCCLYIKLLYCS